MQKFADRVLGIREQSGADLVRYALFNEPVRSVLQVLHAMKSLVAEACDGPPDNRAEDGDPHPLDPVLAALANTAFVKLHRAGVDWREIEHGATEDLFSAVAFWAAACDNWRTVPRLYPDHGNQDMNVALVAVGAAATRAFRRDPAGAGQYLFRVAMPRALVQRRWMSFNTPHDLLVHLNLNAHESPNQLAARLGGWVRGHRRQRSVNAPIDPHTVAVPYDSWRRPEDAREFYGKKAIHDIRSTTTNEVNQENFREQLRWFHQNIRDSNQSRTNPYKPKERLQFRKRLVNDIESVRDGLIEESCVSAFDIPVFRVISNEQRAYANYGFSRLLGFMTRLLHRMAANDVNGAEVDKRRAVVREELLAARRDPTVPAPALSETAGDRQRGAGSATGSAEGEHEADGTAGQQPDETEASEEADTAPESDDGSPGGTDERYSPLVRALSKWADRYVDNRNGKTLDVLAPAVLDATWMRFTETADRIVDKATQDENLYLGEIMHRFIVAFLHAAAVEMCAARDQPVGRRMLNPPVSIDDPLLLILDAFERGNILGEPSPSPERRFFTMLLDYPMWGFFVRPEADDSDGASRQTSIWKYLLERRRKNIYRGDGTRLFRTTFHITNGIRPVYANLYPILNTIPIQRSA